MVAVLYLGDKDINREMVKEGLAWTYREYLKGPYASEYINAETEARSNHHHQGNYDATMDDYEKAIALLPNLAETYYFRAILHGRQKEHHQAIADFTRAIELKPALIEAHYFRALDFGAIGSYEEAIIDMKIAAEAGYEPAQRFLESHRVKPEWN